MRNFQDTFETRKQSCTSAFTICMTISLIHLEFSMDSLNARLLRTKHLP